MRLPSLPLIVLLTTPLAAAAASSVAPPSAPDRALVAGRVRPFERIAGRAVPLRIAENAALMPIRDQALADGATAYVVLHHGVLVDEAYGPGVGPDTRFDLGEARQGMLALLVGVAVTERRLSPDDPVTRFVPEWSDERRAALTVEHLLQGAAGLAGDPTAGPGEAAWAVDVAAPRTPRWRLAHDRDLVPALLAVRPGRSPGRVYQRDDAAAQALALVIERATGARWSDWLEQHLWWPLGAADAWVPLDHRGGTGLAFAGPYVTARDAARLGQLMLDDGRVGETEIVASAWVAQMRVPSAILGDHGYGVWLADRGPGASRAAGRTQPFDDPELYFLAGDEGQRVFVSPRHHLVIARFGSDTIDDSVLPNAVARALAAK